MKVVLLNTQITILIIINDLIITFIDSKSNVLQIFGTSLGNIFFLEMSNQSYYIGTYLST